MSLVPHTGVRSSLRSRLRPALLVLGLLVGLVGSNGTALAAEPKPLRIGTLVPKNSLYHRQLLEIGRASCRERV